MANSCIKIKYKRKRSNKPIMRKAEIKVPAAVSSDISKASDAFLFFGEGEGEETYETDAPRHKSTVDKLREWIKKQRFIPQDLSDNLLTMFLSGAAFDVELATQIMQKYFYSRQEPSPLFRQRDPSCPENELIFEKMYAVPMPDTTDGGSKIVLMGLRKETTTYDPVQHAKALAATLDLLIWGNDFGFGDFVIVFDGRHFRFPQLLDRRIENRKLVTSVLLDAIPGTLKAFYLLYPPPYATKVADSRDGIWVTVVKSKKEMIGYLPADILPLEFGGNLGHLEDLLEQWHEYVAKSREFFVRFERGMMNDYRRRMCHEREVKEGGKNWVSKMKLEAEEWEYKIRYYESMKNMAPLTHTGFGKDRVEKMNKASRRGKRRSMVAGPLERYKKMMTEEKEADLVFKPTYLYHGYATEMRKAQGEAGEVALGIPQKLMPGDEEGQITDGGLWEEEDPGEGFEERQSDSEPEIDFHEELISMNHWLEREPYLPKNIDEEVLITFLADSETVEQAQEKLTNYYYARQSMKAVFAERHPCSPNNLLKYDAVYEMEFTVAESPVAQAMRERDYVLFRFMNAMTVTTGKSTGESRGEMAKSFNVLFDPENQIRGKTVSIIIDMNGYTQEHTQMITRYAAKKICHLFTDCFPAKFNGFYIINPPDHVADYTILFGPFDFHIVEYLEDLPGFLPKKFLTSDLAGEPDAPTRTSLFEPFFKRMRRCGNWLAYEEFIRAQEMLLRMTTTREEFSFGVLK